MISGRRELFISSTSTGPFISSPGIATPEVMRSTIGSAYGSAQHAAGMDAIVQSMRSTSLSPDKFDGIKTMVQWAADTVCAESIKLPNFWPIFPKL